MAPIPRYSNRRRWFTKALLGSCLALAPAAVPASAELSSVDAYGGQAQVLGKPVHHHHAASNGANRAQAPAGPTGSRAPVRPARGAVANLRARPPPRDRAPRDPRAAARALAPGPPPRRAPPPARAGTITRAAPARVTARALMRVRRTGAGVRCRRRRRVGVRERAESADRRPRTSRTYPTGRCR